jgi:hypothetical protein
LVAKMLENSLSAIFFSVSGDKLGEPSVEAELKDD